jgi:flavin reductase (DIM6/NTAB) family NADH-FMN oxidoreductase RutF
MKKQIGPSIHLFPSPVTLIVSGTKEYPNIITIAWISTVSNNPPTIAFSLLNKRYSLALIRRNPNFTVNIPSAQKYAQTDYCGIVSGNKTNKFQDTGFTPINSKKVNVPIIKECPLNLECVVVKEVELGERIIIFGEILETHIDSDKIDENNKIDIQKIDPLVFCTSVREYWSIGRKVGLGFNAGVEFSKNIKKSKG